MTRTGAVILPDIISKEPLGPVVRQGDDIWFNIVKWSLFAMINAEEYGVTSENAEEMLNSENPDVARLLGQDGNYGEGMGLEADWAYNIISQVGNYAESFERNVGMGSPLEIERGVNALWNARWLPVRSSDSLSVSLDPGPPTFPISISRAWAGHLIDLPCSGDAIHVGKTQHSPRRPQAAVLARSREARAYFPNHFGRRCRGFSGLHYRQYPSQLKCSWYYHRLWISWATRRASALFKA